ncbi:MFS general substrate transporter [Thozetella sp. PMI_491]|nr:MFS general substrate transporter [Thozetella sp. PMI_491]
MTEENDQSSISVPAPSLAANTVYNEKIEAAPQELGAAEDDEKPEPVEAPQPGIASAEAMTMAWSKTSLIISYACFWFLYFTNAFQSSITSNLTAYVTSDFSAHELIPTIAIVSNVMSGATYLPLAKLLDIWGRPTGFAAMVLLSTLGLILMATCNDIYTYCAAQVFYSIGFVGIIFSVDVMTSDSSSLKDRGLAFAFTSSPYIITAFAGSKASEGFYESNWRWGFGVWAIVLPIVAAPLYITMQIAQRNAMKKGLIKKQKSGRSWLQNIIFYLVEFDVLGIILLAAGLVLFLLPFSIAGSASDEWRTPHIIVMLVIGILCLIAFAVCEKYVVPKPFMPWELLTDRTIVSTCLLCATYQIAYYCWNSYFTSYLQVVYDRSISEAGYINSIFDVVNGVWLFVVGFLIKGTGRFRWLLFIAVPLYILAVGLLIYFRQPGTKIGYIIMCEIFISFGGGTIIICEQVAVLASVAHDKVAAVLALLGLAGYMGGAVGNSISGAIWTQTLPAALQSYLPSDVVDSWEDIYQDLDIQLSYPIGSAARDAIIMAYAEAQSRMLIAGTAIMALALVWILLLKDIKVSEIQQVKGLLF